MRVVHTNRLRQRPFLHTRLIAIIRMEHNSDEDVMGSAGTSENTPHLINMQATEEALPSCRAVELPHSARPGMACVANSVTMQEYFRTTND